jgi:drug/metabolite transporter (DMT)-like permease
MQYTFFMAYPSNVGCELAGPIGRIRLFFFNVRTPDMSLTPAVLPGGECIMYLSGLFLALAAAFLWGTSGPVLRIVGSYGVDILTINLVRYGLPAIVLWIVANRLYQRRRKPDWSWKNGLFLLGSVGMVTSSVGLNVAFLRISVGLAMVLYYTAPCWVMLGTWFFVRRMATRHQIIAFISAIVGVWKAVGGARLSGSFDWIGVAAALTGAVGYALYVLNGHFGPGKNDSFGLFSRTFFVAAVIMLILNIASGNLGALLSVPPKAWLLLLYLALATTLVPYGLVILALRCVSGNAVAIANMSEVPFSMISAFFLVGENPEMGAITGGALVILGVGIMTFDKGERAR